MGTERVQGSLYTDIRNRVAVMEFGHPAGNSLPSELLDRMAKEFGSLSANTSVSVILLRSEGNATFCAGASLDELVHLKSQEDAVAFFNGFATLINAMRTCIKPIVGCIQGKAVGGGVGLISACDYALAAEAASVRLSELTIGIAPLVIAPAVERKAGKSGLESLAWSPTEWKSAYWAQERGLYSRVYETVEELRKESELFSEKLAACSAGALAELKRALWEGTEHWEQLLARRAALSGKLALSGETKKALEKFKK